jgi:peroxiredoxin
VDADDDAPRLRAGDAAPEFSVEKLDGSTTTLGALLGGRHLVLFFMREFT